MNTAEPNTTTPETPPAQRTKDQTCKERVREHLKSRLTDIRAMFKAEDEGNENGPEDTGPLNEYGLAFDYVAPGTFRNQKEGYWRYQISWGGPSDEFRFYSSAPNCEPYRIEYWFLDWFDGAKVTLRRQQLDTGLRLWHWFADCESTLYAYKTATGDV